MRIGPIDYEIVECERFSDSLGMIDNETSQIKVLKSLKSQARSVTILHECVHGILYQAGMEHDDAVAEILAHGFYDLIRNNPTFFEDLVSKHIR